MCATSMIMDQWNPYIPQPPVYPGVYPGPIIIDPVTDRPPRVIEDLENDKLKRLLETFRKAYEAADEFDELTGQPDCVDPEKAKLIERVEELERRLAALEAPQQIPGQLSLIEDEPDPS